MGVVASWRNPENETQELPSWSLSQSRFMFLSVFTEHSSRSFRPDGPFVSTEGETSIASCDPRCCFVLLESPHKLVDPEFNSADFHSSCQIWRLAHFTTEVSGRSLT